MSSSTTTTNTYSKSDYLQPTFSSSSPSLSSSSTSVSDLIIVVHLWFDRLACISVRCQSESFSASCSNVFEYRQRFSVASCRFHSAHYHISCQQDDDVAESGEKLSLDKTIITEPCQSKINTSTETLACRQIVVVVFSPRIEPLSNVVRSDRCLSSSPFIVGLFSCSAATTAAAAFVFECLSDPWVFTMWNCSSYSRCLDCE